MKTVKQLKEERGVKEAALKKLLDTATAEKRELTEDESTQFDSLEREVEDLDGQIERAEKVEKTQLRLAARAAGTPVQGPVSEGDERDLSKYSLRKSLLSLISRNLLDGIELEMHQEAEQESRLYGKALSGNGVAVPAMLMDRIFQKRDITTATGNGAYTIVDGVSGYVEALRERSLAIQLGADYLTGLTGNFDVPRENGVFAPGWEGETDAAAESNPTYARAVYSPKRLSGFMDLSKQLLIQSAVGIEGRLRNQILQGNAEAIDRAAWNGSGAADDPTGILNDAGITPIAIGTDGGAITKALIYQMIQQLEEASGMTSNTKFVVSPILKKLLKSLALDAGSGKFIWDDNSIDGIDAFVTSHIPKTIAKGSGTNLTAIVLGDMRDTMFGQWGGQEIIVDPYTQAVSGMVRFVVNQYVDFHVTQPGRFQVIKDITTS